MAFRICARIQTFPSHDFKSVLRIRNDRVRIRIRILFQIVPDPVHNGTAATLLKDPVSVQLFWIQIRPGKNFPDPDPQHCFKFLLSLFNDTEAKFPQKT
jgi:hypothetical protein